MSDSALSGIRVLDVSTVLAAPVAATILGDFGAEVVKIEEPGRGDFTRLSLDGPGGRSLQWVQEGRNKQSVTLNLRTERGRELLRGLIPHFDIVITNYRPPTLERWGLDPASLQLINPRAVIVYLTGYGLTGPYRERGAFDRVASAFSGLTYVSGEPERDPIRSGYSVIDFMAAYLSAFAAITALFHREVNGGTGQIVDLALYEAGFRASESALLNYSATGAVRERLGNRNPFIVPASDFATIDGRRISLHAGTDRLYKLLCAAMNRPDLAQDERFATPTNRAQNQDVLYDYIRDWVRTQKADEIVLLLSEMDIPASPIMSIEDIANDPHYRARGTILDVDDPDHGPISMAAPLPHLNGTPGSVRTLGPALGAHTDEVLQSVLGLTDSELAQLRGDGVV